MEHGGTQVWAGPAPEHALAPKPCGHRCLSRWKGAVPRTCDFWHHGLCCSVCDVPTGRGWQPQEPHPSLANLLSLPLPDPSIPSLEHLRAPQPPHGLLPGTAGQRAVSRALLLREPRACGRQEPCAPVGSLGPGTEVTEQVQPAGGAGRWATECQPGRSAAGPPTPQPARQLAGATVHTGERARLPALSQPKHSRGLPSVQKRAGKRGAGLLPLPCGQGPVRGLRGGACPALGPHYGRAAWG